MNPLDKLKKLYFNNRVCAENLGITESRLSNWYSKGFIPYMNGDLIEGKTSGKIKATEVFNYAAKHKKKSERT